MSATNQLQQNTDHYYIGQNTTYYATFKAATANDTFTSRFDFYKLGPMVIVEVQAYISNNGVTTDITRYDLQGTLIPEQFRPANGKLCLVSCANSLNLNQVCDIVITETGLMYLYPANGALFSPASRIYGGSFCYLQTKI